MADNWRMGPKTGTICTAIGWGALYEKGPGPDHLHEVSVPIIERCKSAVDDIGGSICAGEPQGGRDACQGDSGGPFVCRSERDSSEWYLAGIISHGDGCARANEPGVYTRVSLYLDWIDSVVHGHAKEEEKQPLQTCPGYMCIWGGGRCIPRKRRCDGRINCLGGEDEVDCVFEESVGGSLNVTTSGGIEGGVVEETTSGLVSQDVVQDQTTVSVKENLIEEDPILPNVLENIPHKVTSTTPAITSTSSTTTPPTTTTTKATTSTTHATTSTTDATTTTKRTTTTVIVTTEAPIDKSKILDDPPETSPTTEKDVTVQPSTTKALASDETVTTTENPPKETVTNKTVHVETTTIKVTTTPATILLTTTPSLEPESRGDFQPSISNQLEMFNCSK